jgi:preprotein translocase subunit SecD
MDHKRHARRYNRRCFGNHRSFALAGILLLTAGCSQRIAADRQRQQALRNDLAFYLVADYEHDAEQPLDEYIAAFAAGGDAPDGYKWLVWTPDTTSTATEVVTAQRDGDTYVLVLADPQDCLDKQTQWSVRDIQIDRRDSPRSRALTITLDKRGDELMRSLTRRNVRRRMAVCFSGEVQSIATIMSEIGGTLQVSGDPDHIEKIYANWRR